LIPGIHENCKVLVIGIGGGGDVVSASIIAYMLEKEGCEAHIGSIVWERFVYDPIPGPIRFSELRNHELLNDYVAIVNEETYAIRGGRRIVFQAVNVAKVLKRNIYIFDLWRGVNGYVYGVKSLVKELGLTHVIGVDVGGDVLANGYELNLWSPLADSMGLAMLNHFENSYLIVHSPGSDGELGQDEVLNRISIIAANNGYIGAHSLGLDEIMLLRKILNYARSEAGMIALYAFRGFNGELPIRNNTRRIRVNIINTLFFILDPHIAYKLSIPAKIVDNTTSFEEANNKLNKAGIYTEYNLEKDILRSGIDGSDPLKILNIRLKGIINIRMMSDQSTDPYEDKRPY
jgi:hypothetical protein